jgi:hypothetical protein
MKAEDNRSAGRRGKTFVFVADEEKGVPMTESTRCFLVLVLIVTIGSAGIYSPAEGGDNVTPTAAPSLSGLHLPRPDHIVLVIEENKSYSQIIGNPDAPYLNALAGQGALFSRSFGVAYPSQPNYLALFSGSTQGITDNSCPHSFSGETVGSELVRLGFSFGCYSESMPSAGYPGCRHGSYVRKHNPCVNWQETDLPASSNMPFQSFPEDFAKLPTVSIVVPDMEHDMHDGSIRKGDDWLEHHLDPFVRWARTHNSLLVVTWDEDDRRNNNRIPTIFVGPMVEPGVYPRRIDHYDVLRTIEDMYGLRHVGMSETAAPITDIWAIGR